MQLRAIIRHNLGLKIFAFLLAVLTWLTLRYVARNDTWPQPGLASPVKIEFASLPIRVLADPANPNKHQLEPTQAAVVVRGRKADLDKLAARDILLFVELSGMADTHDIKAYCPPGVVVEQIRPAQARVAPASLP
jgi:hypothetical protein